MHDVRQILSLNSSYFVLPLPSPPLPSASHTGSFQNLKRLNHEALVRNLELFTFYRLQTHPITLEQLKCIDLLKLSTNEARIIHMFKNGMQYFT